MSAVVTTGEVGATWDRRLAVLLAMAMFALVVDTSLMNVSMSAVVKDLGTTVSGVQAAIALEALVSAAFILISSKVGDLIGRKRAYVLGLLGYAVGGFISMAEASTVLPPQDQQRVAQVLEEDAQVMTNAQLEQLLVGQPQAIADEIVRINTEARPRALQVALLVPLLAGLVGLLSSFRMIRQPEPKPSASVEGMAFG